MSEDIIECDGKKYKKSPGLIEVGDLFYLPFVDHVDIMKDLDYGSFNPNKIHAIRVESIQEHRDNIINDILNIKKSE